MIKNFFKSVFLLSASVLLVFLMPTGVLADDYTAYELTLRPQEDVMISEVILERQPFNAIAVELPYEVEGLMVNFNQNQPQWELVEIHDDGFGISRLIFTSPAHTAQFKLTSSINEATLPLKATVFYQQEEAIGGPAPDLQVSTSLVAQNYRITTRREWGADEELRIWNPERISEDSGPYTNPCASIEEKYADEFHLTVVKDYTSDGQLLTWPLQYVRDVEKIVVHHTDSEVRDINGDALTDIRDYSAMIRAIYYYHTITRGWGDIGYNYIIDPLGNIYEGRYGGDKVIGAHAQCFNHGTLGIAVIGNYQDKPVPEPAMQALIYLIAQKGKEHGIDPEGKSVFRGKELYNVFGHRDVRPTSCPGEILYKSLPKIRDRAALAMRTFSESALAAEDYDYNAELSGSLEVVSVGPGERKTVTLKFKNIGKKTWSSDTWMHVALNNDPNARIVPAVEGKSFVAADLKETSVAPGKIGTFQIEIEGGYKAGHFAFEVSPVINGRYKISRASEFVTFKVENPDYSYEVVSHEFPKGTVFQGQHLIATLQLKNTGNTTWRNYGNNSITLGASEPKDRASIFIKDNPYRVGYLTESQVAPGEIGNFVLNLHIPEDREGEIIERFTPVIENVGWLADRALGFKVYIKKPVHLAKSTKLERLGYMFPGERRYVQVKIENLGDLPWDASTVETTLLGRGMKVFKRMLLPEKEIKPGKAMIVGFWVEAPLEPGQHSVYLRSRFNNKPIRGAVARFIVEVPKPSLRAVKVDQSSQVVYTNPREVKTLTVQFKNTGNVVWKKKGYNAVHLGTSHPRDRESSVYYEPGWFDPFRAAELEEEEVMPGEIGTFKFKVKSNVRAKRLEEFQLVMERVGWIVGGDVMWTIDTVNSDRSEPEEESKSTSTSTSSSTSSISTTTTSEVTENPENTDRPFRVRLSHSASTATLTADTAFIVFNGSNQALFNLAAGKEITISKLANAFQIKSGATTKNATVVRLMPKEEGGIVEILSMERRPAWNNSLNDNRFRGVVEMRLIDGQVAYINELPLKDYLKGLAEVSNSDPPEKQKVIAVLARTYAKFYMDEANRKFPGMPYDGSDDPAIFQRYLGYGVESRSPNFVTAVTQTEGEVVTYNGQLVKTPYFNQSDGRTRSAEEVWGWTHTPYLKSVADPWCQGLTLNGHGVGLSGYGATKQAESGKNYKEIIQYYYDGIEIL